MSKSLIVEAAHNIGGSLTSVEIVMRWGIEAGFSFDLMTAIETGGLLPPEIDHYHLPTVNRYPVSQHVFWGYFLAQKGAVLNRLLRGSYDAVILNNSFNANIPSFLAAKVARKPVIQFIREFERNSRGWRVFSKYVDVFVAVSQAIRENLISLGIPMSKIVLAPEGLAPRTMATQEEKDALRQKLGIDKNDNVMGFVGRLDWWKGYELFAEASIEALKDNPSLHAMMVGGAARGQEERVEAILQQVEREGLSQRFHMLGEVTPQEVEPLVRGMDVLLHTSIEPEPFGRVLLEAMAVGVPVISSSGGGPREIIIDGESGYLTPPGNAEALFKAIQHFFRSEENMKEVGIKSKERVEKAFSESVCASPILNLLEKYKKVSE